MASPYNIIADRTAWLRPQLTAGTTALLVAAAALAVAAAVSGIAPLRLLLGGVAVMAGMALLRWPEVTVAALLSVGAVKGSPALTAVMPFDLTLTIAGILAFCCAVKVLREGRYPRLWPGYLSWAPLSLLMLFSLLYTPDFDAGLNKMARFVILGAITWVAPFILLDSEKKIRRFLLALVVFGIAIAVISLRGLGGYDRLVAPSGLTLQLGTSAGIAIAIIWTLVLPGLRFRRRVLLYPALAVLFIALVGSGARGAAIGVAVCLVFSLVVYRFLLFDVALIGGAGLLGGLAFFAIPLASYKYLATLITESPGQAMGLRMNMISLGWRLMWEHPFLGVGIGGYPSYSPNPNVFGWPHNLFIEIGAELGVLAVIIFIVQLAWAGWESVQQVRDQRFRLRALSVAVLALMIFAFLQMIKSGDINDNRGIWLLMGLPFVLRQVAARARPMQVAAEPE